MIIRSEAAFFIPTEFAAAFVMPSEFCSRIKLASKMLIRSFCTAAAEVLD